MLLLNEMLCFHSTKKKRGGGRHKEDSTPPLSITPFDKSFHIYSRSISTTICKLMIEFIHMVTAILI